MYVRMNVFMHACMRIRNYICVCIYVREHASLYACVCVFIYIFIFAMFTYIHINEYTCYIQNMCVHV